MAIYKQGMRKDPYIGEIQKNLTKAGYNPGPADSIYGPQTASAVKAFQTKQGITADSMWGPETQKTWSNLPNFSGTAVATPIPNAVPGQNIPVPIPNAVPGQNVLQNLTYSAEKPFVEGASSYYTSGKDKYKNGVLVPEKNWGYLPGAIGGTRGVVAPTGTGTLAGTNISDVEKTQYQSMTPEQLQKLAESNSAAWATATPEEKKRLEGLNQYINGELLGKTFDPKTGVWAGGDVIDTGDALEGNIWSAGTGDRLDSLTSAVDKGWDQEALYNSDLYKSQKQSYDIMGQDAFQNTLGSLASLTGGRASSAAIGQAANAYSQYNQQFAANVLPQLTEQSYNQYQDNITNQGKLYDILANKDLTEYEKRFEYEKYQWEKSEDNPDVKAKMIANSISQLNLDALPEEIRMELAGMSEELKQMEMTTKYMPKENEAKLNNYKATLDNINSTINSRETNDARKAKEDEEKIPMTPTQQAWYNGQLRNLKGLNNPDQAMRWIGKNEQLITEKAGASGLKQLQEELQHYIENPPKAEETVETPTVNFKKGTVEYNNWIGNAMGDINTYADLAQFRTRIFEMVGQAGYDYIKSQISEGDTEGDTEGLPT